jgi:Helix-turn-helix domain
MRPHLTVEQRQLALRLKAQGLSLREIGPQVGCSHQGVALIVRHASRRPVRHDGWVPRPGRLTLADREEITLGLHAGKPAITRRGGSRRRSCGAGAAQPQLAQYERPAAMWS